MMRFLTRALLMASLLSGNNMLFAGGTELYRMQIVSPSAIWSFMPPWHLPVYLPGGPFFFTRGVGFDVIHQQGDREEAACTGFVSDDDRYIHGRGPVVIQSRVEHESPDWSHPIEGQVGISLSGPARYAGPYISALYADYFSAGEDIRPWRNADYLRLEVKPWIDFIALNQGDIAYLQYSILLEDSTTGKFIRWIWQVYDSRSRQPDEFIGIDITPDGGDFAYVATTFKEDLKYSTGAGGFQHGKWWWPPLFNSWVKRGHLQRGIRHLAARYARYSDLSSDPDDYRLRAFFFYPELYLSNPASDSRICVSSSHYAKDGLSNGSN